VPLTRRDFVIAGGAIGATLGGGVVAPVALTWERDRFGNFTAVTARFAEVVVADLSQLVVGEPVTFEYPAEGQRNVLVRIGRPVEHGVGPDLDLVGFSSICPHTGCPLDEYRVDMATLDFCPCQFITFDVAADGIPSFNQATQHLSRILLRLEGDDVVAYGVRRPIYGDTDPLHGVGMKVLEST
jgi:arsenite oxidase small subunit|tara:strand:+ start:4190 stop:4741 length:552 start_codon:yes stop_codon:yes gene_type:complete